MPKLKDDLDPLPSCASCEWATPPNDNGAFIFCHKKKCIQSQDHVCPAYIYDLLKRTPARATIAFHLEPFLLDD